jgi:hypothetical protein
VTLATNMATQTPNPTERSVGFGVLMPYFWWSDGDSNPGPSACKAEMGLSTGIHTHRLPHSEAIEASTHCARIHSYRWVWLHNWLHRIILSFGCLGRRHAQSRQRSIP